MKHLQLSLAASALSLALSLPAFAGYMDTPVSSPSPLPTTGWMDTTSTAAVDPVTEIALSFMQSVLALF